MPARFLQLLGTLLAVCVVTTAACKSVDRAGHRTFSGTGSITQNQNKLDSEKEKTEPIPTLVPTPTPEPTPEPALPTPTPKPIIYPVIDYYAKGTMRHNQGNFGLTRSIQIKASDNSFLANILSFRSSRGEVDDAVKKNVGITTYTRTTPDQLANLDAKAKEENRTRPVDFAMYANKVVALNGDTFEFSEPFGFFILPGPEVRYRRLDDGPISFSLKVNAVIKTKPTTFTINVTYVKLPSTLPDQVIINVKMAIPEDDTATDGNDKGALYGAMPVDKEQTYTIDTKIERVIGISTTTDFNDNDRRQRMEFVYKICTFAQAGSPTLTYDCGKPADKN